MTPDSRAIPFEEAAQIAAGLGGLKPENPVLHSALRLLRGESVDSIHPLQTSLREPHPRRWKERLVAAWTLGRAKLSDDDSDSASGTLIEVLENGYRERGRFKLLRWIARTYAPAFVIGASVATGAYLDSPFGWYSPWVPLVIMIAMMVGTPSLFITIPLQSFFEKRQNDRVRAAAAVALANRGHIEAIGPLSGCLFDSDEIVRHACALALHDLLPKVKESDYGALGADSMTKLGRALGNPDGSLVTKLLDALAKVGTSHAVPHVEKLLKSTRSTLTRDRAQRVIEILIERSRREAAGKDLLRASRSPGDPAELLRPARTLAEAEIEQLLRPTGENLN
jgi:hypothetical protein